MTTGRIRRSAGWIAAGLAIPIAVGVYLLLSGSPRSGNAAPGDPDQRLIAQASAPNSNLPAIRVKTIQPKQEHLQRMSTQAAYVEPYEQADLFSKVSGYLETVSVDIGDKVRKGQVLAELWIPEMDQERIHKEALVEKAQAELKQAEAAAKAAEAMIDAANAKVDEARSQVARYEAEAAFRKLEYQRHLQLFNDRAIQRDIVDEKMNQLRASEAAVTASHSAVATADAGLVVEQAKLRQAQADVTGANARVKVAQAELAQMDVMLGYGKITAPYDGVITKRFFHPGAFVQSAATGRAEPLFHIDRVDRMRIVADFPEADSSWIKEGQPAVFRVDALRGQQFNGKVVRFADALEASSRTMRVEVELDSPTTALRPGMYGSLTLTLADYENALTLPASVLLAGGGAPAVMVATVGRAERRPIEIGQNDGIRMHVVRGLDGSEQVIAEGKESVRDGQPVEIIGR